MNQTALQSFISDRWDRSIVPALYEFIRIPNKSPAFDPRWQENGHMDAAVELVAQWCRQQPIPGLAVQVQHLAGRTPIIYMEVPGTGSRTVLLYGHLDKQPEMTGWREGLGPWLPVLDGERLYGRGGADDGYSAFAALAAIAGLHEQGRTHGPLKIIIEASEESGSPDLPAHLDALGARLGRPDLVICLDSGCGNYEQLWCTTSLRGLVGGTLRAQVLREGVHSGDASGVVPSSFRVLRMLLERIEDTTTGHIKLASCHVDIPAERIAQARTAAAVLGSEAYGKFPWAAGTGPIDHDPVELVLNRTWRPALSVTGAAGWPLPADAGNVLRPATELKLSLRLPPTARAGAALDELAAALLRDPPYGASVSFTHGSGADGWNAPPQAPWLARVLDQAAQTHFGRPVAFMGEGGTIPFMAMLGERYPAAQFLITGVLGPGSNAHGPNEFLHIPMGKRLTCCVAEVLAAGG